MFKAIKTLLPSLSDTSCCRPCGMKVRSQDVRLHDDVSAKRGLPFIYTWKLESLFSSTANSAEKLWDYSGVFPAGGHSWKLAALNMGKVLEANGGKSYLSLFLALLDSASPLPLHTEVVLELSILGENHSQCSKRKVIHRFKQSKSEGGRPYLLSLETLECPSSGFLITEIIDIIIYSEENVPLSPPKPGNNSLPNKTCKIVGFSKLTKECCTSLPFIYDNYIWYLAIRPKGNLEDKGKFISLYLCNASILASSVGIRTEYYYIELVDQIKGKNHRLKASNIVFDRMSPTSGWRKFLSLDALHEPSKGFLVNDTCIIKVGFS